MGEAHTSPPPKLLARRGTALGLGLGLGLGLELELGLGLGLGLGLSPSKPCKKMVGDRG